MNLFRTLHTSILTLFVIVVIAIVTLAHVSISNIVAEQSRAQQQSFSPALDLVIEQILKPLHISETLKNSQEIKQLMSNPNIDEAEVFKVLKRLETEFDLTFFVASESSRMQYNSDGTKLALIEEEVNWYFKLKAMDEEAVADIGKWEDTHFFIDLKMFDEQGNFTGFFGIGKSLTSFIDVFNQFKQEHGYDFIFVDDKRNITLSSDSSLLAADSTFKNIRDLVWYRNLDEDVQQSGDLNNKLLKIDDKDHLLSQFDVNPFGWTLYILNPLESRQTEISRAFIYSIVTVLVLIFGLYVLIYNLLCYFKRDIQDGKLIDRLTGIYNHTKITLLYNDIVANKRMISIVLIDIENFPTINSVYGQMAGDQVLMQVVNKFNTEKRRQDIFGRWSGGQFIMLLPDTGPHEAYDIAKELNEKVAVISIPLDKTMIKVSCCYGVSFTASERPLSEVTSHAEEALAAARKDGANLVKLQLIDAA